MPVFVRLIYYGISMMSGYFRPSSAQRDRSTQLVIFIIDEQRYALPLSVVERVVRMVEVTPLPNAPDVVRGVISVQGQIVPVIDLRRRFRCPSREIGLNDHLVIARTARRTVALIVDTVLDVAECAEQDVIAGETILPGLEYVTGVVKLYDGMVLIHDLDTFLSLEEERALDEAVR